MEHNKNPQQENKVSSNENSPDEPTPPKKPRKLGAEEWVLIAGLICFVIFLGIMTFLFIPLLSGRSGPVALPPAIVKIAATQGFVLPPTWTPGPTQEFRPSPVPSQIYDGTMPTRMYTPVPTSLPGVPMSVLFPAVGRPSDINVIDLARILQGESPGDKEAAYYVGWVAKNRLLHAGYGDTYAIVSSGFFGYRADMQPNETFLELALSIMRDRRDPTEGSLYALSRTDITNLGIPPQRADITKGEWFFFKTWPLAGR